jgi:hypothetical protein
MDYQDEFEDEDHYQDFDDDCSYDENDTYNNEGYEDEEEHNEHNAFHHQDYDEDVERQPLYDQEQDHLLQTENVEFYDDKIIDEEDDENDEAQDTVQPLYSELNRQVSTLRFGEDPTLPQYQSHRRIPENKDADGDEKFGRRHPCICCTIISFMIFLIAGASGGVFFFFTRSAYGVGGGYTVIDTSDSNPSPSPPDTNPNDNEGEVEFKPVPIGDPEEAIGEIKEGFYRSLGSQPMNVTLPIYNPEDVGFYDNCEEFREDMRNALYLYSNQAILNYADKQYTPDYYEAIPDAAPTITNKEAAASNGENSYETNNQVTGVDEADVVKSNGKHVFAAYGDQLVIWKADSGEKMSVTKLGKPLQESRAIAIPTGPKIRSLLLDQDRLVVVVDGYPFEDNTPRIIKGREKSIVYMFNVKESSIPNDGKPLTMLSSKQVHGEYHDARMIDGVVHLVTVGRVDFFYHLKRFLGRDQERFKDDDKATYLKKAPTYAGALLVPSFIDRVFDEVNLEEQECKNVLRISMLRQAFVDTSVPKVETPIQGFLEITSFNMQGTHTIEKLEASSIVSFTPNRIYGNGSIMYSSTDYLILANRGYGFDATRSSWKQFTFITAFSIVDSLELVGTAHATGYVLNQYSMDIWNKHLRVATTEGATFGCIQDNPDSELTKGCNWQMISDSVNSLEIFELPSTTQGVQEMDRKGFLTGLGETQETIKSVRFMKERAWVVTFKQTDPLYALDLSDSSNPVAKGELKITGYSSYLHPYNTEGTHLIGVGQDATKEGRPTGLQITLYNVEDLENPQLEYRYNIKDQMEENKVFANSAAEFDPKAFRFLPSGKLIIPTRINPISGQGDSFDGFHVFDISIESGIKFSFSVSHFAKENSTSCWYKAYLSPRSLVHDGVLTTIKGHTIFAHDLNNKELKWGLNLDKDNASCFGSYWETINFQ